MQEASAETEGDVALMGKREVAVPLPGFPGTWALMTKIVQPGCAKCWVATFIQIC